MKRENICMLCGNCGCNGECEQQPVVIHCGCDSPHNADYTDKCISCGAVVCDNCERCEQCDDLWAEAVNSFPNEPRAFRRGWLQGRLDAE